MKKIKAMIINALKRNKESPTSKELDLVNCLVEKLSQALNARNEIKRLSSNFAIYDRFESLDSFMAEAVEAGFPADVMDSEAQKFGFSSYADMKKAYESITVSRNVFFSKKMREKAKKQDALDSVLDTFESLINHSS